MTRLATLEPYSARLSPVEVARLWFRRGADFAGQIHEAYPDFPKAGPDGLFLLSQVSGWFDRFHGTTVKVGKPANGEEEEIMRVASGGRG